MLRLMLLAFLTERDRPLELTAEADLFDFSDFCIDLGDFCPRADLLLTDLERFLSFLAL